MKKFGAKKDKALFKVHVVRVAPWPVTAGAGASVEVAWKRGARRGSARGVGAPVGADGLDVGARFSVPATLYRVRILGRRIWRERWRASAPAIWARNGRRLPPPHQDPTTGAHDKKWLTLELVRPPPPSSRSSKPVPLARGVVDLAALAARVRAAGGARARADLPLAPASGDVPPTARLTIEVELEGVGGGDDADDRRRSSSAGGESFAADTDAAAVATALAAAEAALAPTPATRSVAEPTSQPLDDGDGASSDGELLAAAAAAADAEDDAALAPPRHRTTTAQESDAWASLHSSAIASAVASAMASEAGSPQRPRGTTDGDGDRAGINPFASAESEPAGDAAADASAAASNPFEEYSGAEAVPPPPPPPPLPPLALHPPLATRHARTPSHELYLDGALPLPGETGFGSVSAGGSGTTARPRSGGRPPTRDPIGDALEAPPPLDAIDLPPDAHDAAVEAGTVAAAPASRSRPQSASRCARDASAPTSTALLSRALLDETGAAIAANRRFARRAAGALATTAARDGAVSPPTPDSPTAGAARARAALAARSRFSTTDSGAPPPPVSLHPAADLEAELLTTAALEACIYLARPGDAARPATTHAPARRLARTIVALGADAGAEFGVRALAAVGAAARAGGGGVAAAVRWWSAALQLRWMLWAMTSGGDEGDDSDEFAWAATALAPPLRELEAALVSRALHLLWHGLVAGATAADPVGGNGGVPSVADDASAAAEAAAARWLEALRAARGALDATVGHAPAGHVALFRAVALGGLLERLDGALFGALVGEEGGGDDNTLPPAPPLPPSTLPFSPSTPLTFSTGVALKLLTSRLAHWAADAGVRDGAAPLAPPPPTRRDRDGTGSPSASTPPLFPRTRAAADLLMVPKEALADAAVRADVAPGLRTRSVAALLARYAPDAAAPDPLPPGLLDALAEEAEVEEEAEEEDAEKEEPRAAAPLAAVFGRLRRSASASSTRRKPAVAAASSTPRPPYNPPSEAALLAAGLVDGVALDQGADSDDELADLAAGAGAGGVRFDLLRALWASAR